MCLFCIYAAGNRKQGFRPLQAVHQPEELPLVRDGRWTYHPTLYLQSRTQGPARFADHVPVMLRQQHNEDVARPLSTRNQHW